MSNAWCPDSWPLAACSESESPGDSPGDGSTCAALNSLPEDMRETVILAAKEFLWNATNQRFGTCPITIRPCKEGCLYSSTYTGWSGLPGGWWGWGFGAYGWEPFLFNGTWFNIFCNCGEGCDSSHMSTIQIPGPVASVVEVVLDGQIFTDWTFDNLGLHRTDGGQWPMSQKQALPLTDPDTFGVTYMKGVPVPAGGQLAAAALACEFAKAFCGDNTCQLPQRVRTITREGVTVAMQDNFSMLFGTLGPMTGIWKIDQWIASVNYSAKRRSRVLTPNAKPTRRV